MGDDDSLVVTEVAHETGAVGVVAENRAVISDGESIYGPGVRRARGEIVGDVDRRDLVGQRDVESPATLPEKLPHPLVEGVRREVIQPIRHCLARLTTEQTMDERRPAMGDGVSHYSILVRRFGCVRCHARARSTVNRGQERRSIRRQELDARSACLTGIELRLQFR